MASIKRQLGDYQTGPSKVSPPRIIVRVGESDNCFKEYCLFYDDEVCEEAKKIKRIIIVGKFIILIHFHTKSSLNWKLRISLLAVITLRMRKTPNLSNFDWYQLANVEVNTANAT